MPTDIVLKDIMGVDSEQPKEVVEAINDVYKALAEGEAERAHQFLTQLETMVPNHPELSRIRRIVEKSARRS